VDVVELYFLADQWVLSSGKQPMLSAWYLQLIRLITSDAGLAPYLATESCVLAMLWGIWQLSREYLKDEKTALLLILAAANYRYLNIGNLIFNPNTVVTLCWIMAVLFCYRALRYNRLTDWATVGFWLGLGFHGKYTISMLVLAILLFMFFNRHARRFWKTPGPYLTIIIAIIIFLPHLIWLIQNDFPTFNYAFGNHQWGKMKHWYHHILFPVTLLFSLFLVLLPSAITLVPLTGWAWQLKQRTNLFRNSLVRFQIIFLSTTIGVPLAIHLAFALLGRKQPTAYMMAIGMFIPLLFVSIFRIRTDPIVQRRTMLWGFLIMVITMLVWAGTLTYSARFGKKPTVSMFPGKRLAEQVEQIWADRYGAKPCPFVSEMNGYWLSGNVNTYGKQHIRVHCGFVTTTSTDQEVNQYGGIILWNINRYPDIDFAKVQELYSRAEELPVLELPYEKPFSPKFLPERIGVAVIPPQEPANP
jgi:hypothetical protein